MQQDEEDAGKATFVFFDIGGTLGDVSVDGTTATLAVYPDTRWLLNTFCAGAKLGVISNVPSGLTGADLWHTLEVAGISQYFDRLAVVASTDAGYEKPAADIYRYAAACVGQPVDACMFIGEDPTEVLGARTAGMHSLLKPVVVPKSE